MYPKTYLFVPADRSDRFSKAFASGADRVVIDLEDAVKPEAKAAARQALATANLDWSRVVVRVNSASSSWWIEDWMAVAACPVSTVIVPKAENPEDLTSAMAGLGRDLSIIPLIETATGLANVASLLRVPGVERVAFGHLDYAVDIGATPIWEAMMLARSTLILEPRLAGRAAPIDSVTPDLDDLAKLRQEAIWGRQLGFRAKLLIHPNQVGVTKRAFAPTEAEVVWARRVIASLDSPGSNGAAVLDRCMIDKPVANAARLIIAENAEFQQ